MNNIKKWLANLPGWKTKRKLVVFHSDDWGSIRIPTNKARSRLSDIQGVDVSSPYCHFDSLESSEDIEALYDVLTSVQDTNGEFAKLTANCVVCNPDFDQIRANDYQAYVPESIDRTFERYGHFNVLDLWREGLSNGFFIPQYHGREHVNVPLWMNALKSGSEVVRAAFNEGTFAVNFPQLCLKKDNFQAAWDFEPFDIKEQINQIIVDGLGRFHQHFGFQSTTAIAPSYTWTKEQEKILFEHGVNQMQGIPFQKIPNKNRNYRHRFRSTNKNFQQRNAFFEPSLSRKMNADDVLYRAGFVFKMKKPLIISVHRLNFIGALDKKNRKDNLYEFKYLLERLVQNWPDIEFLSASELQVLMNSK